MLTLLTPLGKAMGIAERRLREKEELKSKIICTAWDLVKTEGWSALSIRKIADKIDYSVPVIYDHFKNKEAILLEFSKKGFRLLTETILGIIDKKDVPENKIRAIADAYWNFAAENKELYQIMFSIGTMGCDITEALPERDKFRSLAAGVIEELIAKSGRDDLNACLKYHTLFSVMHGLISIKLVNTCTTTDSELNKMVLDDAVDGYIRSFEIRNG
ncbi:TetR/AcrR family transcriptional regulator [Desertivirga brevis]|uniref:TetR/AcrR family transcriptional regulator n=1 Tax=Desertivirga brevis TaxID=2810310 RepID=UPI001A978905|nr:TetR/AcrR family transcriptional regulator [Pedobacter sp. SYSU D00873]